MQPRNSVDRQEGAALLVGAFLGISLLLLKLLVNREARAQVQADLQLVRQAVVDVKAIRLKHAADKNGGCPMLRLVP